VHPPISSYSSYVPIPILIIIQPCSLAFRHAAQYRIIFLEGCPPSHYCPFSASRVLDTIIGSLAAPPRQCSALRGTSTPSFLASACRLENNQLQPHEHLSVSLRGFQFISLQGFKPLLFLCALDRGGILGSCAVLPFHYRLPAPFRRLSHPE
jgi:hypothetical protein